MTIKIDSPAFFLSLVLTMLSFTNVYARRESLPDTIAFEPGKGQHASTVAALGGAGSVLLTIISAVGTGGTATESGTGIFAFGIVAGVVAVISGIIGLVNRKNWIRSGKPFKNKFQKDSIRNKSVLGIVLGLLAIGASLFLILIKTGVMGF